MCFIYKKDILMDENMLLELKSLEAIGAYVFITLFIKDIKADPIEQSMLKAVFSHHFNMHIINVDKLFNYLEDTHLLKFSS